MSVDNYYEILGIESSADEETIRKAIKDVRRKARQKTGSPVPIERRSAEALMEQLDSADRILLIQLNARNTTMNCSVAQ